MRAYVLLRDNPYMAVSDRDGGFEIKNLPAGLRTFQLWHEKVGFLKSLEFGDYSTDTKGQVKITIGKGVNQLPEISVDAKRLGVN